MGNPRGGFCYPRFPGRNLIWNDVLLGGRIIGEPRGKKTEQGREATETHL